MPAEFDFWDHAARERLFEGSADDRSGQHHRTGPGPPGSGQWHRSRAQADLRPRQMMASEGDAATIGMTACPRMGGAGSYGGVAVEWGAATDVGMTRAVNEDSLLASLPIFVVADGMGGHHAGDVASRLVVEEFERSASDSSLVPDDIAVTMHNANAAILREGDRDEDRSGMGTTAVGLALVDNGASTAWLVFNVGDSRAYCFANGELEQLSVDHSYVQELVAAGQLSEQDARLHPHRNVVTRALGVESGLQPDYWLREPTVGERYLLCSDGLTTEVTDTEIHAVLAAASSPDDAAADLVRHALTAGGHDNVTVLVLDVVGVTEAQEFAGEVTSPRGVPVVEEVADTTQNVEIVVASSAAVAVASVEGRVLIDALDAPRVAVEDDTSVDADVAPDTAVLIDGIPEFDDRTDRESPDVPPTVDASAVSNDEDDGTEGGAE